MQKITPNISKYGYIMLYLHSEIVLNVFGNNPNCITDCKDTDKN